MQLRSSRRPITIIRLQPTDDYNKNQKQVILNGRGEADARPLICVRKHGQLFDLRRENADILTQFVINGQQRTALNKSKGSV